MGTLKKERAFGLARKLLDKFSRESTVRDDGILRVKLAQQRALCTYKDPDLLTDEKLDSALQILKEGDDLDRTTDRESLGLAGAIFKRKWEVTGDERDLEQSLAFNERGYSTDTTVDYGWTGINAAFVLDFLADHESPTRNGNSGLKSSTSELRRNQANDIRREITTKLTSLIADPENAWLRKQWWFWVTLAEAYFALDEFDKAIKSFTAAKAVPDVPDWERESTARQLATLLILKRKFSPGSAESA